LYKKQYIGLVEVNMNEALLSKKGKTLLKVASLLLTIEKGQRIPKVESLAQQLNVGRGTIQSSLKILEEAKAIELLSRGHLGTFLLQKDVSKLLEFAGVNTITAVMPLPYSKKYEGLATALTTVFHHMGIRLNLAFMRGSNPRLEGVKEGRYDFAVVSFMAAKNAVEKANITIEKRLGAQSYVSKHKIYFADSDKTEIEDGMRIGIDSKSADQRTLAEAEAQGKKVTFVETTYMHLLQSLEAGLIDATVWNADEVQRPTLYAKDLTSSLAVRNSQEISETALVAHGDKQTISYLLGLIDKQELLTIQKQVVEGEIIPSY
jgi:hypothetical protein